MEVRRWRVEAAPPQDRLDAYLAARVAGVSRSQVVRLLREGQVLVDGQPASKSEAPRPGSRIEVRLPEPAPSALVPEDLPLDIVYQDADLAVIDKPAGMVVHPSAGHPSGTLVHALLFHIGDLSGVGGVRRPGIVHRLDRDTSGLLVVAKHDRAHRALAAALKSREVRRSYLAASWGHLDEDAVTLDAPIGRSPSQRKRMAVVSGGRAARTHFTRLERWRAADLLGAELETGRTHQIRVHLAHIGHPVVGDATYAPGRERGFGGPDRGWAAELARRTPRQFLHAARLEFRHPRTGLLQTYASELPPDLAAVAAWARDG